MKPRTHGDKLKPGRSLRGWNAPDGIETFYDVRSRDSALAPEEFARLPRRPVLLVLDNLRSAFNVGAIFRTGDACRVAEIVCCGYTCHPPHHKLEQTSLGTDRSVPWRWVKETTDALLDLRSRGVQVIGAETVAGATKLGRIDYRFPVALVLGNEALGLSRPVLDLCDSFVEIPVFGFKNSLNVATAAAVLLYDVLRRGDWLRAAPDWR